jgi:hypothetical protein
VLDGSGSVQLIRLFTGQKFHIFLIVADIFGQLDYGSKHGGFPSFCFFNRHKEERIILLGETEGAGEFRAKDKLVIVENLG